MAGWQGLAGGRAIVCTIVESAWNRLPANPRLLVGLVACAPQGIFSLNYDKVTDMKMRTSVRISLILLASTLVLATVAAGADYKVVKTWKLGGDGGWDYLTADSAGHRLFIARATRVMVIDTESGKQVGEIPDTAGVHGIALDPEIGRGFTSNGREDTVSVFDLKSLAVRRRSKSAAVPTRFCMTRSRSACLRLTEKVMTRRPWTRPKARW